MSNKPTVTAKAPIGIAVEKGKDYFWCSCGNSKRSPFCDGGHKGSEFTPVKYTAAETKTVHFCQCKQSKAGATCDGAHKAL